jgi:hypothetical protein
VVNALPAVAYLAALQVLGPRARARAAARAGSSQRGRAQVLSVLDHLLTAAASARRRGGS